MFPRRFALVAGLILVSAFKLWLIHTDEIYGSATGYDALWFVNSAKHWYWGADYSWLAFVRPPAYPLFIALVHLLALPLRIGIELTQMAGYVVLIAGLRKAGFPRLICLVGYAVLILHPATQFNRNTMADTFYAAILPLALGGLLLTLFTKKVIHPIWSGIAFVILWNTREESFLIPPLLLVFLGIALIRQRPLSGSWKAAAGYWVRPTALLFGVILFLNLAIYGTNYRVFRSFSKSEMSSPAYQAAYKALLRIKPSKVQRFVPISTEALNMAYEVSPTFAQLRPELEGPRGKAWQVPTYAALGVHEMGPWIMWALRDAANAEGQHKNPKSANSFYRRVAKEINRACDDGRIPSRQVLTSFLDPTALANIRYLPQSLVRNAGLFVLPYEWIEQREDDILTKSQRELYDEVTNRRADYRHVGTLRIAGWAFQFGDPVRSIIFKNNFGEIEASTDQLLDGPDIVERFAANGEVPPRNRFVLPVEIFRTDGLKGEFVFVTQGGTEYRENASTVLGGGAPTSNGKSLMCQIESQELNNPPTSLSETISTFIGRTYRFLVIALSVAGLAAIIVMLLKPRQLRLDNSRNAALVLLGFAIFLRVLFFSFLDATWWEGGWERYLLPVMPLYSCFAILLVYQAFSLWQKTGETT